VAALSAATVVRPGTLGPAPRCVRGTPVAIVAAAAAAVVGSARVA
jgi:hypothetical protein